MSTTATLCSMLANYQIRHQATCNVGSQPGNCRWQVNLCERFVWICIGEHAHFTNPKVLVWFGLCCLMTPGLSKGIRCHV